MRWLIVLFWAFIGFMLLRQFYYYNLEVEKEAQANARATQYSLPPPGTPATVAPPVVNGASVRQVAYAVKQDAPTPGSFTVTFTVQNVGNAKAVGVQMMVRPYRGVMMGGVDLKGGGVLHRLPDSDPLAVFGQWASIPDLAPGETSTQSLVFLEQTKIKPGNNPDPEIDFETEKAKP